MFKVHLPVYHPQQLEEDTSLLSAQRKSLLEERKKELLSQQKYSENEHLHILDTMGMQEVNHDHDVSSVAPLPSLFHCLTQSLAYSLTQSLTHSLTLTLHPLSLLLKTLSLARSLTLSHSPFTPSHCC